MVQVRERGKRIDFDWFEDIGLTHSTIDGWGERENYLYSLLCFIGMVFGAADGVRWEPP